MLDPFIIGGPSTCKAEAGDSLSGMTTILPEGHKADSADYLVMVVTVLPSSMSMEAAPASAEARGLAPKQKAGQLMQVSARGLHRNCCSGMREPGNGSR